MIEESIRSDAIRQTVHDFRPAQFHEASGALKGRGVPHKYRDRYGTEVERCKYNEADAPKAQEPIPRPVYEAKGVQAKLGRGRKAGQVRAEPHQLSSST